MPKNSKGREIAEIIPERCIGCQICIGSCPLKCIVMDGNVAKIDADKCSGCGMCFDVCPAKSVLYDKIRPKKTAAGAGQSALSEYKGVAVYIEIFQGEGAEVSWELVGKARELADTLGTQVLGFLPGNNVGSIAKDAITYGCDVVYTMQDPMLAHYLSKPYGRALVTLCNTVKPEILILGATPQGRDLSSVVATQLSTGLTADCTGLAIDPADKSLLMSRPTFGGNIMATIACRTRRPQMSTVRPRVMKMPRRGMERKGEIKEIAFEAPEGLLPRIIEFIAKTPSAGDADITKAPVLVVVGKGACDAKTLPMMEELARLLGGTVACSRPVVEEGLLPYARQVGQTGKTVSPRIYIGVAVSGAVQHMVGMQGADKIIAINLDRNAPMAKIADYAIIGDYKEIVPRLIKGIEARMKLPRSLPDTPNAIAARQSSKPRSFGADGLERTRG